MYATGELPAMSNKKVDDVNGENMVQMVLRTLRLNKTTPKDSITVLNEEKCRRIYSLSEVGNHDSYNDCWIVLYDRVYDVTEFLHQHPGGIEMILEYAGRDGSVAFRGHSKVAIESLKLYEIGELPEKERIYRKNGLFKSDDLPE